MKTHIFNKILFVSLLMLVYSIPGSGQCYELVWSDEFNYNGLPDNTKWSYQLCRGCGNQEAQYYTENRLENARVEDSVLIIEARLENMWGYKYTSAKLESKNKGDWQYGRIEARAKLPGGKGAWPAIWMMPTASEYGSWPSSGEIDIMEYVGYQPGVVHGTVHTEAYNHSIGTQKGSTNKVTDAEDEFHIYAIEWTTNTIDFFVDSVKYYSFSNANKTYKEWPFDKPFFLILNLAIGGTWGGAQGIDDSIFPIRLVIDYVRVFQHNNNIEIKGPDNVYANQSNVEFSIPVLSSGDFSWKVDNEYGIQDITGQNPVLIDWGCESGIISCTYSTFQCPEKTVSKNIEIKPYDISGPLFIPDNEQGTIFTLPQLHNTEYLWELPDAISYDGPANKDSILITWSGGNNTLKAKLSNTCGEFELFHKVRLYGQYPYPNPDLPHVIPGVISPVNYDFGGEGIAFHDNTIHNSGNGPRADESVDTELSSKGSYVAWIERNEWLKFTVDVEKEGFYELFIDAASEQYNGGGPFTVLFNDVEKAEFDPLPTGSWSTFSTLSQDLVYLSKTDTIMTIDMGNGGFNLGYIAFVYDSTQDNSNIYASTKINNTIYPNPADGFIHIQTSSYPAAYSIFSSTGNLIASGILSNVKSSIDVSKLSSGLYFLRCFSTEKGLKAQKFIKK